MRRLYGEDGIDERARDRAMSKLPRKRRPVVDASSVCPESAHDAMKRDAAIWQSLANPRVIDPDPGNEPRYEVRECHCHSTIYREMP